MRGITEAKIKKYLPHPKFTKWGQTLSDFVFTTEQQLGGSRPGKGEGHTEYGANTTMVFCLLELSPPIRQMFQGQKFSTGVKAFKPENHSATSVQLHTPSTPNLPQTKLQLRKAAYLLSSLDLRVIGVGANFVLLYIYMGQT